MGCRFLRKSFSPDEMSFALRTNGPDGQLAFPGAYPPEGESEKARVTRLLTSAVRGLGPGAACTAAFPIVSSNPIGSEMELVVVPDRTEAAVKKTWELVGNRMAKVISEKMVLDKIKPGDGVPLQLVIIRGKKTKGGDSSINPLLYLKRASLIILRAEEIAKAGWLAGWQKPTNSVSDAKATRLNWLHSTTCRKGIRKERRKKEGVSYRTIPYRRTKEREGQTPDNKCVPVKIKIWPCRYAQDAEVRSAVSKIGEEILPEKGMGGVYGIGHSASAGIIK